MSRQRKKYLFIFLTFFTNFRKNTRPDWRAQFCLAVGCQWPKQCSISYYYSETYFSDPKILSADSGRIFKCFKLFLYYLLFFQLQNSEIHTEVSFQSKRIRPVEHDRKIQMIEFRLKYIFFRKVFFLNNKYIFGVFDVFAPKSLTGNFYGIKIRLRIFQSHPFLA